jgi:hypothetical protein
LCDSGQVTKANARPLAVLAVLATSSVLLAACGGGPAHNGVASLGNAKTTTTQSGAPAASGSSGSSGSMEAQLLKYTVCMRAHGISDFPDPVPSPLGGYGFHYHATPGSDLDPNSPHNQSATKACQRYVPPSLANLTPAQMMANGAKWTDCMRAHGEPDFPEPNAQGLIEITMDPNSAQFQKAEKACQSHNNGGFDVQMPSGGS